MFNFSKREINVLTVGGIVLIVFLAAQFIYSPAIEKRKSSQRILAESQAALKEMVVLKQEFSAISTNFDIKAERIAKRKKNFSLFSFLDSQARLSDVKENVVYMKPFTKELENSLYTLENVKVKLTDVYLKELIDFLFRIESSPNSVTITSFALSKSGKDNTRLEAIIETETLMLKDRT